MGDQVLLVHPPLTPADKNQGVTACAQRTLIHLQQTRSSRWGGMNRQRGDAWSQRHPQRPPPSLQLEQRTVPGMRVMQNCRASDTILRLREWAKQGTNVLSLPRICCEVSRHRSRATQAAPQLLLLNTRLSRSRSPSRLLDLRYTAIDVGAAVPGVLDDLRDT